VDVSLRPNVHVLLCVDDHRQILHHPAIREDITVVLNVIVALVFVGASIRTELSLLVLGHVVQDRIAVCLISALKNDKIILYIILFYIILYYFILYYIILYY